MKYLAVEILEKSVGPIGGDGTPLGSGRALGSVYSSHHCQNQLVAVLFLYIYLHCRRFGALHGAKAQATLSSQHHKFGSLMRCAWYNNEFQSQTAAL